MTTRRPARRMDPYASRFWEFTVSDQLRCQRCTACSKLRWPPGPVCDRCLAEDTEWITLSGRGKVLSWVKFHRQYFPEYPAGHCVVVLELDEGLIFAGIPVTSDEMTLMSPDDLRDGMRMKVVWIDSEDDFGEYKLPAFTGVDGD